MLTEKLKIFREAKDLVQQQVAAEFPGK